MAKDKTKNLEDWEKDLGLDDINIEQQREANKDIESSKKSRTKDIRFWKPTIKNEKELYEAKIRLLPRKGWLEDNTLPWGIPQYMHYIKEPKYNIYLNVKCRKTLGQSEKCPICEANWATYNAAKTRGDKFLMDTMINRRNRLSYIGNILVVQDLTKPEFDDSVKLWEHTQKINGNLMSPLKPEEASKEPQSSLRKSKQKKEFFIPYHPTKGRTYDVIVKKDSKSGFANYDDSDWGEEGLTPLANSGEEIMAILEQTFDLQEFIQEVPTAEELARRYQEFNDKLSDLTESVSGSSFNISVPDAANSDVAQGDSKSYFAVPEEESKEEEKEEISEPVAEPVAESVDTPEPVEAVAEPSSDAGEDDDLPF